MNVSRVSVRPNGCRCWYGTCVMHAEEGEVRVKGFGCARCGQLVFFDNSQCLRCQAALGFDPGRKTLLTLTPDGDLLSVMGRQEKFRRCTHAARGCNWLLPAQEADAPCLSCAMSTVQPPEASEAHADAVIDAEKAKRRVIAQLLTMELPMQPDPPGASNGLSFVLQASQPDAPAMTGHANGVITLALDESDSVHREQLKRSLGEPYRTLLGHFRHEIGHYYWIRLVEEKGQLEAFRGLFGDERADYANALAAHYESGGDPDWPARYVSAYASSHPWEDWAETFAHYLHISDVLDTAAAFGIHVAGPRGPGLNRPSLAASPVFDLSTMAFEEVVGEWLPLSYALNALTRSMGKEDLYPFVLAPAAVQKLSFVHDAVVTVQREANPTGTA